MNDEVVIYNDVNIHTGERDLLVKRAEREVNVARWVDLVPRDMAIQFDTFEIEQGRFVWHYLHLKWATRELIGFDAKDVRLRIEGWSLPKAHTQNGLVPAVGWTLSARERMSGAIRSAAEIYWGSVGIWPKVALSKMLPSNAPTGMHVADGIEIKIMEMSWVWRGMIIVL